MRFSSPKPRAAHIYGTRSGPKAVGATDFLRANEKMAALLPAAMRMASLQKDCAASLPAMFAQCDILQFQEGELVLATPNAAVAARLKQQLPKLQSQLQLRGWQVQHIRLKVQVAKSITPIVHTRQLVFPQQAASAFAELGDALAATPQNASLIAAVRAMASRRR